MNYISVFGIFAFLLSLTLGYESLNCLPSSCAEIALQGNKLSGIYTVYPRKWFDQTPFQVYCDMETDGGGWTVFQRRDDIEIGDKIRENFFRNWDDYKNGFGDLEKEFWLGNEYLYILTNQDRVILRVELGDFSNNSGVAEYEYFHVTDEKGEYKLKLSGFHGAIGDSLTPYSDKVFVTRDRNDVKNCAKNHKGGWWYYECHHSNLNGLYSKESHHPDTTAIVWHTWFKQHLPLKRSEMKLRPVLADYYNNCHFKGCPQTSCVGSTTMDFAQELQKIKQTTPLPLK